MAEYILKDMVKKAGRAEEFHIASAAVSCEELGNPVYPPAARELSRDGIDCRGHAAHRITRAELERYELVFYMDESNARYLRRMFGAAAEKCRPLLPRDVADPWYSGDFAQTRADIYEGCRKILEECAWT